LLCLSITSKHTTRSHFPSAIAADNWDPAAQKVMFIYALTIEKAGEWAFCVPYDDTWRRALRDWGHMFAVKGTGASIQHYKVSEKGKHFE
jgi:hypothetical protein